MPLRIEIAGPPGSGKTTIAKGLEERDPAFRPARPPSWKDPLALPFYLKNGLALAPVMAGLSWGRGRRPLAVHECVWLALLNGWDKRLARMGAGPGMRIIDQGPVYMISMICVHRDRDLRRPRIGAWLDRATRRWARTLDAVVLLDAPDDVLMGRINTRLDDHIQKGSPEPQVREFLKARRAALGRAVDSLKFHRGTLAVLRFDTGRQSPREIIGRIIEAMGPGRDA